MTKTKINWCVNPDGTPGEVWNPVTGCSKVSTGCKNCYAERYAERFWGERKFTDVVCNPGKLGDPAFWHKPRSVFVNSMSDLFHESVPDKFIDQVFAHIAVFRRHNFLILTKRPKRMLSYFNRWTNGGWDTPGIIWHDAMEVFRKFATRANGMAYDTQRRWPLPNVGLGVSIENQQAADRIPLLLETPAEVRFVSCEPLLGPVDLGIGLCRACGGSGETAGNYDQDDGMASCDKCGGSGKSGEDIDWVICGGESGPHARPMQPSWVRSLRDQCLATETPFFFKQWGAWAPDGKDQMCRSKNKDLRFLDGKVYSQFPY